jgi:hypothetical protein
MSFLGLVFVESIVTSLQKEDTVTVSWFPEKDSEEPSIFFSKPGIGMSEVDKTASCGAISLNITHDFL